VKAVEQFCSEEKGAGRPAEVSLEEQLVETAVMFALAAAVAGIGAVLTPAVAAGATAFAAHWALKATQVTIPAKAVLDASLLRARGAAEKQVPGALREFSGGAGVSLAAYEAVLLALLSAEAKVMETVVEQQLIDAPPDPPEVKWGVATALYDALEQEKDRCKQIEWDVTSDFWFRMQTQARPGIFDTGIMEIDLADGLYPDDPLRVEAAYLGGEGANEMTVAPYAKRPIGEIGLPRRLIMRDGNLGWGILECGWQVDIPFEDGRWDYQYLTRWGDSWLCAKALGLRNIADDDPRRNDENTAKGLLMVWNEIKGQSVAQLGGDMRVTSRFNQP